MRNSPSERASFSEEILKTSKNNFSRVILALDVGPSSSGAPLRSSKNLIDKTAPYLCAVKLGRSTVLNLGKDRTRVLVKASHANDLPCIIDDKLGDIDDVNAAVSRTYFDMGFDGIIVNPIAGWKGGLEPVFKSAEKENKGVIVLVFMSNPGASDSFGQLVVPRRGKPMPQYELFAECAKAWGADGAVVGATRPEIIRKVRAKLADGMKIYSPGIGAQGGRVLPASRAGADFFIIGRAITRVSDPEKAAHGFARQSVASA